MESHNAQFEQLAQKYLNGKLIGDEYDQFLSMMKKEEYQTQFSTLKNNWLPDQNHRSKLSWERLNRRINQYSFKEKTTFEILSQNWFVRIAAVLIVGLLISTTWLFIKNENLANRTIVVETQRGEKSKVYLPDGTEVWLNASSKLTYKSFSSSARAVKLTGEAFFKVHRNEKAPFTVTTSRSDVQVLGTEFNVMAYEELKRNEISLFHGSVNVKTPQKSTILKVGERLTITNSSQKLAKANLDNISSWVQNKLSFSKVPFNELILRLENWYNVDIEYNQQKISNIEFSGTFKNDETVWQVLDAINVYMPVTYKRIDNRKVELMIK